MTMMNTATYEQTRHPAVDLPFFFPPFNPKCRHCVIRNGIPRCGLFHDMTICNGRCPYAEYAPMRFPGRVRISFGELAW